MQLIELSFLKKNGLNLFSSTFDQITLLVGPSGAGKSVIINFIYMLNILANEEPRGEFKWSATFKDEKCRYFVWSGQTYIKNLDKHQIVFGDESLVMDGREIFRNADNEFYYMGENYSKTKFNFDYDKSLLNQLDSEYVKLFIRNINNIVNITLKDNDFIIDKSKANNFDNFSEVDIDNIYNLSLRLFICFKYYNEKFNIVKNVFTLFFPYIDDMRFYYIDEYYTDNGSLYNDSYILQLKYKDINDWISIDFISEIVLYILLLITAVYTSDFNGIYLFDEIENVVDKHNINLLIDKIFKFKNKQFIISSHNENIINAIPSENWRLVKRNMENISTSRVNNKIFSICRDKPYIFLANLNELKYAIAHDRSYLD